MILRREWFNDPDNEDLVFEICDGIETDNLIMDEPDPIEVAATRLREIGEKQIADMLEAGEIPLNN